MIGWAEFIDWFEASDGGTTFVPSTLQKPGTKPYIIFRVGVVFGDIRDNMYILTDGYKIWGVDRRWEQEQELPNTSCYPGTSFEIVPFVHIDVCPVLNVSDDDVSYVLQEFAAFVKLWFESL